MVRPRILDVGCGTGAYLHVFRDLGIEAVGIDASPRMLAIAKQRLEQQSDEQRPEPEVRVAGIGALAKEFDDASFDGLWCSAVLVHVPRGQAPAVVPACCRILKDDGVLYPSAQLGSGCAVRWEGRAFFYYKEPELRTQFRDAGLEVVETWREEVTANTCGGKLKKYWRHYLLKKARRDVSVQVQTANARCFTLLDLGERRILDRLEGLVPHVSGAI